jgi:hypothetical protein
MSIKLSCLLVERQRTASAKLRRLACHARFECSNEQFEIGQHPQDPLVVLTAFEVLADVTVNDRRITDAARLARSTRQQITHEITIWPLEPFIDRYPESDLFAGEDLLGQQMKLPRAGPPFLSGDRLKSGLESAPRPVQARRP